VRDFGSKARPLLSPAQARSDTGAPGWRRAPAVAPSDPRRTPPPPRAPSRCRPNIRAAARCAGSRPGEDTPSGRDHHAPSSHPMPSERGEPDIGHDSHASRETGSSSAPAEPPGEPQSVRSRGRCAEGLCGVAAVYSSVQALLSRMFVLPGPGPLRSDIAELEKAGTNMKQQGGVRGAASPDGRAFCHDGLDGADWMSSPTVPDRSGKRHPRLALSGDQDAAPAHL